MAEGKAYYKDYDVEIPETLSAYGYGDSPLTFVSLSGPNHICSRRYMDEKYECRYDDMECTVRE